MIRLLAYGTLLVASSPSFGYAQNTSTCNGVATAIQNFKPSKEESWKRILDAANESGVLRIQKKLATETNEKIMTKLRDEFRASPDLLKAISKLSPDGSQKLFLFRYGSGEIYHVESVGGTMHCQNFVFFKTSPDGPAKEIEAPPVVKQADESTFCWGTSASVGEV